MSIFWETSKLCQMENELHGNWVLWFDIPSKNCKTERVKEE